MKSHYRAVVIGGGITGCAIAYHLAKAGWSDIALIERRELTSGSTWHAAAANNQLHDITNMATLQAYTIDTFKTIEAETGQSCGIHPNGGIYIATTEARADQLAVMASKAKYLGVRFERITDEEALDIYPLLDLAGSLAVYFTPHENHVDPNGATQAFAKGARRHGAEVIRFNPVLETNPTDAGWEIVTEQGTTMAEHVVNAAGLWAREVGRLAGLSIPVMPMEHQYLVTEAIPEVAALTRELPMLHDNDFEYYMRQEGHGFLFGAYEAGGKHWAVDGTPLDFDTELLPDDLDRIADNYMRACERVPPLAEAGVKRVINGPMIWSPDVQPLVGPVPGLTNYWAAVGVMAGFSQSAGIGRTLAEWMIEGQPTMDVFSLDIARFGAWADHDYVLARSAENYSSRFRIYFPYEERQAGRKRRVRPVYEAQAEAGAVSGASVGWEVPKYFARGAADATPDYGFRRPNWFATVGAECRALRESVGVLDTSHYAKYRVRGADAEAWLDTLLTNRVPAVDGKTVLAPMTDERGRIQGDFTLTRMAAGDYLMIGSGLAEEHHLRWFANHRPDLDAMVESTTEAWAGFNIAGPRAREVLAALTNADVSNEVFPFLTGRALSLEGIDAFVLRITFTGELGYEIYVPEDRQVDLHDALARAGRAVDMRPVGSLAQMSLRLEKGYGGWGLELTSDYSPYDAGLGLFVKLDKDFVGCDALRAAKDAPGKRLRLFEVESDDADAFGGEPVFVDGTIVGEVTSGGYGHCVGKSLALAHVDAEHDDPSIAFSIDIVGRNRPARILAEVPFDPTGARMRA